MTARRTLVAAAALLAGPLAGCFTYKPVTTADPQSERVRVRFTPAAEVRVTGPGDSSYVLAVRELKGIVIGVRPDSIRLVVSDGEDARGRSVADGVIAMIPRSANPNLERRRMSASRSTGAVLAGMAAVALVFVLVSAIAG
jgi:hypothetical protein